MGTTAQRFYPYVNDWDGTDPASGDVRAADTTLSANNINTSADFGTSGSKEIALDPDAASTTTGVQSRWGWAIDISGSDGMDSAADAKRVIPAGTWTFQGTMVATPAAALNNVVVKVYVYRVAAAPSTTRTLLFAADDSPGVLPVAGTGTNWDFATGQSQIVLEAGETIQVSVTLNGTGQLGGLQVQWRLGDSISTNDNWFDVPSPGIRTQYPRALADSGPAITDALTRAADFPRALADSGPAITDSMGRVYTGARDLTDSGPQITDDLQRVVTFPRSMSDSGPTPTDDLQRAVTFPRDLADVGPQITDALTRVADFPRDLTDSGPQITDDLARAANFPRDLTDSGPQITDDLQRLATFNRDLADDGPTPTDDLQRAWTGARELLDDGPQITDTLARQVTYARTLEDDISQAGGGGVIKRPIFATFD